MLFTKKLFGAFMALTALGLAGCHDGFAPQGNGTGGISPTVEVSSAVNVSQKAKSRAADAISVSDLSLAITATDGSSSKSWVSVMDYPTDTQFPLGEYLVEAKYGKVSEEGFGKPAYYGSQTVTVRENETTPVAITATLANAMVSVTYSDAFKRYMAEYDANLHTSGGQYIYFAKNETRAAYMAPGKIAMNVWFQKPNGQDATLKVAEFNAVARHHYHVTVDLENGFGDAVLVITFDDTLDQEEVKIDLTDDIFNAPAPEIQGNGVENGGIFTNIVGDEFEAPIKVNINARGGLSEVILTTQSQSLQEQGWPAEVDLMSADAVMQARLRQLGFDCRGVWKNPETLAVLDFSGVVTHLTEVENMANSFAIAVVDKLSKTCEPFTFGITSLPLEVSLEQPAALAIGEDAWQCVLHYNGKGADNVKYSYLNTRGTWTSLAVKSVEATDDATRFLVKFTVPADANDLSVRAETKVKNSETLTVQRKATPFTVTFDEKDIWATHATISLASDAVAPEVLAGIASVYLSTDGNFTKVNATVDGASLRLTGLQPGTKYTAKVSLTADEANAPATTVFTTEAASQLPNADFEQLTQTLSESKLLQGGQWSISWPLNYDNYAEYTISEPNGWASVNAKTTSGSNRNTWFVVPSTFNSSLTYVGNCVGIKGGGGKGSGTPDAYKDFKVNSGTNAMVIRNVAWDAAGKTPDLWRKEFAGSNDYYNHNEASVSQCSAGKLFLGSYSYSNGTETYNEGTLFGSRPASLSGWYTYAADANDPGETGVAEVKVMAGDQVIGTGKAVLNPAADMTKFTINIAYVANAPKATKICVMMTSSNHASYNQADETARIKVSTYNSRYESYKIGATLVVDNLNLVY